MGPEIGIPVTKFRNLPFLRRLEFQPQTNHRRFIVDLKVEQSEGQKESQGGCRRGSEQSAKANRRAPPSGLETFFPHLRPLVQENDFKLSVTLPALVLKGRKASRVCGPNTAVS